MQERYSLKVKLQESKGLHNLDLDYRLEAQIVWVKIKLWLDEVKLQA
jgi:hypothetical protein